IYVLNTLGPSLLKFDYTALTNWNTSNPKDQRNYMIAKVSPPYQLTQIKDDQVRIQALTASYTAAQLLLNPTSPNGGGPPPGGMPFQGGPFQGGPFRPPGFQPAPFNPGAPGAPPPGGAGTGLLANVDPAALLDRTTKEDRRNDWEMKID